MKTILIVYGTRPEAIKLAPVIKLLQKQSDINITICVSGQHREMLRQANQLFQIDPDIDLDLMRENQSLVSLSAEILNELNVQLDIIKPDLLVVHGDTTTAMSAAIAAFYKGIPVAHIEAGLRTESVESPFPEEFNRRVITLATKLHFCPTLDNQKNLLHAGVDKRSTHVTGNTAIDSLKLILGDRDDAEITSILLPILGYKLPIKRFILVTAHRRENLGERLDKIIAATKVLANSYMDMDFIYSVNLNPLIREQLNNYGALPQNFKIIEPQDYLTFSLLMKQSFLVMTDSGGIQEEGPSLDKPVVVMREETERQEGVKAGTLLLAGTETDDIVQVVKNLIDDDQFYAEVSKKKNPYGDGNASPKIIEKIKDFLCND